jgi:hypothetical protein
MDRKLEGNAAGVAYSGPDAVRQSDVMSVAWDQVATGLGDSDDGSARLQLPPGQTIVQEALEVEGGHIGMLRVVPPCLAAELSRCIVVLVH